MNGTEKLSFLIVGASGYLGRAVALKCGAQACAVTGTYRRNRPPDSGLWIRYDFPRDDPFDVFLPTSSTHVIITARLAERSENTNGDQGRFAEHVERLVRALAWGPERESTRLVYVSSDAVFSGRLGSRLESDVPDGGTEYGIRHRLIEDAVRRIAPNHLVIRPSFIFGRSGGQLDKRWLRLGENIGSDQPVFADTNVFKSPLHVDELAAFIVRAACSGIEGVLHASAPRMSVYDFFARGMQELDLGARGHLLKARTCPRSSDTSLATERAAECIGRKIIESDPPAATDR